jgi:hypothetical protein
MRTGKIFIVDLQELQMLEKVRASALYLKIRSNELVPEGQNCEDVPVSAEA